MSTKAAFFFPSKRVLFLWRLDSPGLTSMYICISKDEVNLNILNAPRAISRKDFK